MAITKPTYAVNNIQSLPDIVLQQATTLKQNFDKASLDNKTYISDVLIPNLETLDAANVKKTGDQTIVGIKTFSSSPIIPTPTTAMQACTKKYAEDYANSQAPLTIPNGSLMDLKLSDTAGQIKGRVLTLEGEILEATSTTVEATSSLISLPSTAKDGILQGILKGRSWQNAVANGDFRNGTTGWSPYDSTLTATNGVLSITGDGVSASARARQVTPTVNIKNGSSVYMSAKARVTNNLCTQMMLILDGTIDKSKTIATPIQNQWYTLNAITISTADENYVVTPRHYYADAATANGKVMEVQQVQVIDLTTLYGAGNEPDLATCDKIFNYIDGLRSVEDVRVKSVGKNLFDKSKTTDGYYYSNAGVKTVSATYCYSGKIKVLPSTSYKVSGTFLNIVCFDSSDNFISYSGSSQFVTPVNVSYVRVSTLISNKDTIQLEEGTVATAYEPYEGTEAYINASLRKLPNGVIDEITLAGDKVQRTKEYVLQSANVTNITTGTVNIDYVSINKPIDWVEYGRNITLTNNIISEIIKGYGYADNISNIGFVYSSDNSTFGLIVAKGTYATLAAAQTALTGTKIIYQLAAPIVSKIEGIETILSRPSGTIYVEPFYKFTASPVAGVIAIPNTALTIKAIESLKKVTTLDDGNKEYTPALVTSFTTTTITITSPDNTKAYEVVYEYDNALSTLATLAYTYPNNLAAQAEGNMNAIAELSKQFANFGGIVESGINANGRYIKFDDGTMTATNLLSGYGTSQSDLGSIIWTFPATFTVEAPKVFHDGFSSDIAKPIIAYHTDQLITQATVYVYAPLGKAAYVGVDAMAIGRWK